MRHRDSEVIVLEQEGSSALGWLLMGAAIGAGLALLLAPASGADTRRRLAERARELRDAAEDTIGDMREQFDELRDELVDTAEGVKEAVRGRRKRGDTTEEVAEGGGDEEEAEEPVTRGRRATPTATARAELERRLAAARARRRTPATEGEEPVA